MPGNPGLPGVVDQPPIDAPGEPPGGGGDYGTGAGSGGGDYGTGEDGGGDWGTDGFGDEGGGGSDITQQAELRTVQAMMANPETAPQGALRFASYLMRST